MKTIKIAGVHCPELRSTLYNTMGSFIRGLTNHLKRRNLWRDTVIAALGGGEIVLGVRDYPIPKEAVKEDYEFDVLLSLKDIKELSINEFCMLRLNKYTTHKNDIILKSVNITIQ